MDNVVHPLQRRPAWDIVRIGPIHGAGRPAAGIGRVTGFGSNDSLIFVQPGGLVLWFRERHIELNPVHAGPQGGLPASELYTHATCLHAYLESCFCSERY